MDESIQISEEIGNRIREIRVMRKMSQQELAARADLALSHVSDIENGKKSMKLVTFIKIIKALKVSADSVLRINVTNMKKRYYNELFQIVDDCTPEEIDTIKEFMLQLKKTMRKSQPRE